MWNYVMLQTILLGDSGVGKTSLLVQFDTGKFQTGTFSATVGIGFTVSAYFLLEILTTLHLPVSTALVYILNKFKKLFHMYTVCHCPYVYRVPLSICIPCATVLSLLNQLP